MKSISCMKQPWRTESVSSAQNPKIKHLLALQEKSRLRRSEGLFVVEGLREVRHALEAGCRAETLFVCPEIFHADANEDWEAVHASFIEVPAALYGRMALRGSTEGIIGLFHTPSNRLEDLSLPENALVVVLENIEKPGNIGAVLRSADGAGADALIVCRSSDCDVEDAEDKSGAGAVDLYNPNTIRSSLGAVFTVPVAVCESSRAIAFLKERGIRILTAQLQDSSDYYDVDMTGGTALVIGSEADGLSPAWRDAADRHILIPMEGKMDSLNASVSAAILLYEARRQRGGRSTGGKKNE